MALAIGLVAGRLLFGGDGDGADAAPVAGGGAADVAAGCQLLAGLPERFDIEDESWGPGEPWLWRLQGVTGAFAAAARADDAYAGLDDDAQQMIRAQQTFDLETASDKLADLHEGCAERSASDAGG